MPFVPFDLRDHCATSSLGAPVHLDGEPPMQWNLQVWCLSMSVIYIYTCNLQDLHNFLPYWQNQPFKSQPEFWGMSWFCIFKVCTPLEILNKRYQEIYHHNHPHFQAPMNQQGEAAPITQWRSACNGCHGCHYQMITITLRKSKHGLLENPPTRFPIKTCIYLGIL